MVKGSETSITFKAFNSEFNKSMKDMQAEQKALTGDFKLTAEQMKLNGSAVDKLESTLGGLTKQYELSQQKSRLVAEQLEAVKAQFGENSTEAKKMEATLTTVQTAEAKLANAVQTTQKQLARAKEESMSYGQTMDKLTNEHKDLDRESENLERTFQQLSAELGSNASEADKVALANSKMSAETDLARKRIALMEQALEATNQEFGETSREAIQMGAKLDQAKTAMSEMGREAESIDTSNLDEMTEGINIQVLYDTADAVAEIGGQIAELGQSALDGYAEAEGAIQKLNKSMGASSKEAEQNEKMVRKLFREGYAENYTEVADAVQAVRMNLVDLSKTDDIEQITKQAMSLEQIFDADLNETLRGARSLMENYGLTGQEAMDLIAKGSQNGLDYTNELGDNLAEYTPLFADAGYSAEEMFSVLQTGVDAGTYNLDRMNDVVKEFALRLSGGDVTSGIDKIIERTGDADGKWRELKTTVDDASISNKDKMSALAFQIAQTGQGIEGTAQLADIFGTQGEDAGFKVITAMGAVRNSYGEVEGAGKSLTENDPAQDMLSTWNTFKDAMVDIGKELFLALTPAMELMTDMAKVIQDLPQPTKEIAGSIGALAIAFGAISAVLAPVIKVFGIFKGIIAPIGALLGGGATAGAGAGAVGGASGGIAGGLTAVGGAIVTALPWIALIVGAVAGAYAVFKNWDEIIKWVKDTLADFGISTSEIWQQIKTTFETATTEITTFFKETWGELLVWWNENQNELREILRQAWEFIKIVMKVAMEVIIPLVRTGWDIIKGIFETVWNAITTVVKVALDIIKGIMGFWISVLNGDWDAAWNAIKTMVEDIMKHLGEGIKRQLDTIFRTFSNIWETIKSTTSRIWNQIPSSITQPIERAYNSLKRITDNIKTVFQNAWNFIRNIFSGNIQLPHIPLPHIYMSGSFNPFKGQLPSFGINWYAKGGLFNGPSVVGVGEAGMEAVVPLEGRRMAPFAQAIAEQMPNGGGGGGSVMGDIIINNPQFNSRSEMDALANKIGNILNRNFSNNKSGF